MASSLWNETNTMVYNNMDSRVTSWSGCLLLLGSLVVLFITAADQVSAAQRQNGMESQLEIRRYKWLWARIPYLLEKKQIFHLFWIKIPPIRLPIQMRWVCFWHFIENKSKRHCKDSYESFPDWTYSNSCSSHNNKRAFGWWSPVNTVPSWTETPFCAPLSGAIPCRHVGRSFVPCLPLLL